MNFSTNLFPVWNGHFKNLRGLEANGVIEPSEPLGVIGKFSWFVPKFTAIRDPTLVSYFGLRGEENRMKLANTFLRPTTWEYYCLHVSKNNCLVDDGVAIRAPKEGEGNTYFVNGVYIGHFRATEKNNCTLNPNCTGKIAQYSTDNQHIISN